MDRKAEILKYAGKSSLGIEIAPWFAPIAPKQEGYNVKILDVFPTDELVSRAKADPNIADDFIARIEPVDFVGSAVDIEALVTSAMPGAQFDYIISSHNFEHLPNPIKFLQGCERLLKPSGILSMAIPDHRACFDHFRFPSTIADWLGAYHEDRRRPSAQQIFAQRAFASQLREPPGRETAFYVTDNPVFIQPDDALQAAYAGWQQALATNDTSYTDTHCSVLTATSLKLLILECRFLGLTSLAVRETAGPNGCEFFVHLEHAAGPPAADFHQQRAALMHRLADEAAQCTAWGWRQINEAGAMPAAGSLDLQLARLQAQISALTETLARPKLWQRLSARLLAKLGN